jgi:hypothetical protein
VRADDGATGWERSDRVIFRTSSASSGYGWLPLASPDRGAVRPRRCLLKLGFRNRGRTAPYRVVRR